MRGAKPRGDTRRASDVPRFEIDSTWLRRGALALAVIAFIVVLAKASILMFSGGGKRLERHERAAQEQASQPATQPEPPAASR
jgi:hypothetical protein